MRLQLAAVAALGGLLLAQPAVAQDEGRHPGGVKFGLSFPDLTEDIAGDDVPDFERRTRLAFGGFLTIALTPRFALQPEILLTQKGGTAQQVLDGEMVSSRFNLSYWEIPVLARLLVHERGRLQSNLVFGPAVGINRGAEVEFEANGSVLGTNVLDEEVAQFDLGMVVGGGLQLEQGRYGLIADLRYTHGFSNIFDEEAGLGLEFRNRALTMMVGVVLY